MNRLCRTTSVISILDWQWPCLPGMALIIYVENDHASFSMLLICVYDQRKTVAALLLRLVAALKRSASRCRWKLLGGALERGHLHLGATVPVQNDRL